MSNNEGSFKIIDKEKPNNNKTILIVVILVVIVIIICSTVYYYYYSGNTQIYTITDSKLYVNTIKEEYSVKNVLFSSPLPLDFKEFKNIKIMYKGTLVPDWSLTDNPDAGISINGIEFKGCVKRSSPTEFTCNLSLKNNDLELKPGQTFEVSTWIKGPTWGYKDRTLSVNMLYKST